MAKKAENDYYVIECSYKGDKRCRKHLTDQDYKNLGVIKPRQPMIIDREKFAKQAGLHILKHHQIKKCCQVVEVRNYQIKAFECLICARVYCETYKIILPQCNKAICRFVCFFICLPICVRIPH